MVRRDAVGEAVGPARVLGDVAADGAGLLARRVGDVHQAVLGDALADVQVDDAGLDDGAAVHRIDFEDTVHAGGDEEDAPLDGDRAAAEARPGAARDEGDAVVVGQPDDAGHLLGGRGEHDGLGEPPVDGAVELEDQHVLGGVEDVFVAHDALEDVD